MAACVAPRAVARPRLDRRRVSRSPVVRRTTRASSEADAEKRILESATRRTSGTPRPLPPNFDLDTAVLLGGFAFESYSTPEGGVVDADVQGGSTAYLSDFVREVYAGVLEVTMVRAEGLPRGDTLGLSDPYCVVSVGSGSSARTGTKRFTLDPKWDDEAPMRLLVKRTRPGDSTFANAANQTLTVRVLDEDGGKSDDLLGVTRLPLRAIIDGSLVKIPLTGKIGLAVEEEVTATLTADGGGGGAAAIVARLRFVPFNPRPDAVVGQGLRRAARLMERKGEKDGSESMRLAAKATGAVAGGLAFVTAELNRGEREGGLWAVKPDGEWATLATTKRLVVRGKDASPHDFEKVCFVESTRTDTQAAVWRCVQDRVCVVSFRGTEMSKPMDVLTDVNLAPAAFTLERVEVEGTESPRVHGGFLAAYDSVKRRILAAVDDVVQAGYGDEGTIEGEGMEIEGDRALRSDGEDDGWHVFVTGHSLGGALCTLLAADLGASDRKISVTAYNFGSPRVGNRAFVAMYNDLVPDSIRVVNGDDLVPTLPALLGYRHVDHGVRIDSNGLAGCSDAFGSNEPNGDSKEGAEEGADVEAMIPSGASAGWMGNAALRAAMRGDVTAAAESVRLEIQSKGAAKIVELADALGVGTALGVDEETAADAANALATLVSASAVGDHFEDKYYAALRDAAGPKA